MAGMFRVSFIARVRKDVSRDRAEQVLAVRLTDRGLMPGGILRWIEVPTGDGRDMYLKFNSVVTMDAIDDAWNLKTAKFFTNAGYGKLAWKITPLAAEGESCEETASAIPLDLFRGERQRLVLPPLFGSDLFWGWIESLEAHRCDAGGEGNGLDVLQEFLGGVQRQGGLRIVCAACRKMRDADGRWVAADTSLKTLRPSYLSHGICPECAKALYPDLYLDKR